MTKHSLVRKINTALSSLPFDRENPLMILACSMGKDSMAMTLGMMALQETWNFRLHAVYVNHGIRKESNEEAQKFLHWAQSQNLSAETATIEIPKEPSVQAAARRLRYQALCRVAKQKGATAIVTGHTQSDQSETLLMRLLGGAGLRGLSGMQSARILEADKRPIHLIRPLLDCSQEEIISFLKQRNQTPMYDPSNENVHYFRSRVRHNILPLLRKEHPGLDHHFGQLTKQLRKDADYLEAAADDGWVLIKNQITKDGALPIKALQKLHPAMMSRIIQKFCPFPLSSEHIEKILLLCQKTTGSARIDLPGFAFITRCYDRLYVRTQKESKLTIPEHESILISDVGHYPFAGGVLQVSKEIASEQMLMAKHIAYVKAQAGSTSFVFRSAIPGDKIALPGFCGRKKLSDFWIDLRVPVFLRKKAKVLCNQQGEILWIAGFRFSSLASIDHVLPQKEMWRFEITPSSFFDDFVFDIDQKYDTSDR